MLAFFQYKRSLLVLAALFGVPVVLAQASPTSSSSSSSNSSSSSSLSAMPLPDAPSARAAVPSTRSARSPYEGGGYGGAIGIHAACGGGLDFLQGKSQGTLVLCGAGFTLIPYTALELGGLRLQDGSPHFYLSEDFIAPITPVIKRLRGEPIGIVGYTKIVGNSNRLDYGVGWEHHLGPSGSVGLEVRDYLQFTNPVQHAVVFRLTLVGGSDAAD